MQYLSVLYEDYGLDPSVKMKPVMSVDDLVLALHYHWALDDSTFFNERQRVQLATMILLAAYTGQRPCSILETARKRQVSPSEDADNIEDEEGGAYEDGDDESDSDGTGLETEPIDADTDGDEFKSEYDDDEDEVGIENLPRGILYKHVKMRILRNRYPEQRNPLVMEVNMVHTKGEENNPQP